MEDTPTAGYVISTAGHTPLCARAIRGALSTGLPVALLDETTVGGVLIRKYMSPLLRRFTLGSSQLCGRIAGEYLLAQGHRSVVFISPNDSKAARARWTGLCYPFRQVGLDDAVAYCELGLPLPGLERDDHSFDKVYTQLEATATRIGAQDGICCPQVCEYAVSLP